MARASKKAASKKRISTKSDVIIKAKATITRIVDINNEIVRLETNDKGQVTEKQLFRSSPGHGGSNNISRWKRDPDDEQHIQHTGFIIESNDAGAL
jgi:hypothetical protein